MGTCGSCCRSCRIRNERRVLLVGLDNSGKTTLLHQLTNQPIKDIKPTVGFNAETINFHKYTLHLWDICGSQISRPLWVHHYSGTQGIIFVVDAMDKSRYQECKEVFETMLNNVHIDNIPILILANKLDNDSKFDLSELKTLLEVDKLKDHRDILILPISAKKDKGITEALEWLCNNMSAL